MVPKTYSVGTTKHSSPIAQYPDDCYAALRRDA